MDINLLTEPRHAITSPAGVVFPAIPQSYRQPDLNLPLQLPRIGTLRLEQPVSAVIHPGSGEPSPCQKRKRVAPLILAPEDEPSVAKQSKWTPEEDNLVIELRGQGMKWDDIAERLSGRTSISCRLRYQNYLEKRAVWDEEKKNKLAGVYARFKDQMWQKVGNEMGIPWRSAESMHWQLGEREMNARANAPLFKLHPSATSGNIDTGGTVGPDDVPSRQHQPPHLILTKADPGHSIVHEGRRGETAVGRTGREMMAIRSLVDTNTS